MNFKSFCYSCKISFLKAKDYIIHHNEYHKEIKDEGSDQ